MNTKLNLIKQGVLLFAVLLTGLNAQAAPSISLTSPTDGQSHIAPASVSLSAEASDTDGTITKVVFYRDSTLIGTATSAPYSIIWYNAPAGTYSLTAVATDNKGGTTTSEARSLTVLPNQPPIVALNALDPSLNHIAPASITLSAEASDTDGTITKVVFYRDSTLIGTDTSAPYSIIWYNAPAGTYSLTAVATDNKGGTTTSEARSLTVNVNQLPMVALSAPDAGQSYAAPGTITLSAEASDSDGTITKVAFYRGTTLIGTAMSAPYSITWNNAPVGTYSLTAVATDNKGGVTTSEARSITVNVNQLPTVALSAPDAGQSYVAPAAIDLSAEASDTDGTIAKVDFYRGTTLIDTATSAPYSITWNNALVVTPPLSSVALAVRL
jgi:sulfur relay (sulfurtransferase) complex TusBCD TusD component (DsrE family)